MKSTYLGYSQSYFVKLLALGVISALFLAYVGTNGFKTFANTSTIQRYPPVTLCGKTIPSSQFQIRILSTTTGLPLQNVPVSIQYGCTNTVIGDFLYTLNTNTNGYATWIVPVHGTDNIQLEIWVYTGLPPPIGTPVQFMTFAAPVGGQVTYTIYL